MNEALTIYIDQLRGGKSEKIDATCSTQFLQVEEPGLRFDGQVIVRGVVYLAGNDVVFHLDIDACASVPCSICSELVKVPISLRGIYHVEPIENVRTKIYDMSALIRENVLLEAPTFAECQEGKCPERKHINKYLKKEEN